jgi:hypothetical protein
LHLSAPQGAGNKVSRLKGTEHGDSFKIFEKSLTEVCAKRTDSSSGWGLDLQVVCMQGASAEVVKIGSSGKDAQTEIIVASCYPRRAVPAVC